MIQRILNIISSNSLLVVIYLINKGIDINYILNKLDINICFDLPRLLSYVIYILLVLFFAFILTCLFGKLRAGEISKSSIEELDVDNSGLLAIILAYVFVGLSVSNFYMLIIIFCFLLIFNLCGTTHIYNPIFYVFGYHYYYIKLSKTKILVMTKTKYPMGAEVCFPDCRCLNDYTYIDMTK